MRVLVTGGYGFIGSFVAERFHKEGHEVYIIDNLSTGDKSNITFKHKSFQLHVEDRKCEEVFRSCSFDVVIHLAAQVDVAKSIENPVTDTSTNILGLVNMLELSAENKVKKLIFASSAAVYGNNNQVPLHEELECEPASVYGLNKFLGESYCRKWMEVYGLDTLCFRFSNVYGPRQGNKGEGGVVSIFHEKLLESEPLTVYGDGNQTRDFIFVSDVADAIYRASYTDLTGVYNLSTQTECSINQFIRILRSMHPGIQVNYAESREGDIYRSSLNNAKVKRELDWLPLYNFEEGIHITYEWFAAKSRAAAASKRRKMKKRMKLPGWARAILPYFENMTVFALVSFISLYYQDGTDTGGFDYKIIYIILLGILYGSKQAFVSVVLSSSLLICLFLSNGRDLVSILYNSDVIFQIAIYLFFGLAVGYSTDRKKQVIQSKDLLNQAQKEKLDFLSEVYNDTLRVKKDLQDQIRNNGDSLGKIYNIIKELESMEPEQSIHSTVSVLEKIMRTKSISIYSVKPNAHYYIRLLVKSYGIDLENQKSLKLADYPELLNVIETRKPFMNRRLKPGIPMLAAPIVSGGDVVALVCIHEVEFERLSLYYENLFHICVDLISSSVSRAFQYVAATAEQRFIHGTQVLQPHIFDNILETKRKAKDRHNIDFMLLSISLTEQSMNQVAEKVSKSLRDSDYLGLEKYNNRLQLLLSNTSREEAEYVIQRLQGMGVDARIVGEEAYA